MSSRAFCRRCWRLARRLCRGAACSREALLLPLRRVPPPQDTCGLHPPFRINRQGQCNMHRYLLHIGPRCSSEGCFVTVEVLLAGICRRATLITRQVVCAVHGLYSLASISSDIRFICLAWPSYTVDALWGSSRASSKKPTLARLLGRDAPGKGICCVVGGGVHEVSQQLVAMLVQDSLLMAGTYQCQHLSSQPPAHSLHSCMPLILRPCSDYRVNEQQTRGLVW